MITKLIGKIRRKKPDKVEDTLELTIFDEKTQRYVYFEGYMEQCGIIRLIPDVYAQGILRKEDVQLIISHIAEYNRRK